MGPGALGPALLTVAGATWRECRPTQLLSTATAMVDAHAAPTTGDDQRTTPQRQAEALADLCTRILTHGAMPERGGHRPHLNVIIRLGDLETRARAAMLDLGGTLTPASLRMLACDAAVVPIVPIVLNGHGQPLDIGRLTRVIPDGIPRAVTARDGGCARCGRPPSWCEIHHVLERERGGPTSIENCVMLCRACHRLINHTDWQVRPLGQRPPRVHPTRLDRSRPTTPTTTDGPLLDTA